VTDPLAGLDARLNRVERSLAAIDARLEALESESPARPATPVAAAGDETQPVAIAGTDLVGALTLVGRTFVVFAGAYVLRALTESGTIDRTTGVALGLTYAAVWTLVAWRVAPRGALSATFFGACTVLAGFPLVWEATTRFGLLSPAAGAATLAATTTLVLVTAWRRNLHALAWIAAMGASGLAFLLLVMTGTPVPFTVFLIGLGVAALWLGYDREWTVLRWPVALVADVAVVGLAGRALTTPPRDVPFVVLAVQVLLLVGYLGSIAVRTLVRGRDVLPFEVVQTGAMLFAGLGGAMYVAWHTGNGTLALGLALVLLAQASYGVAFAFVARQQGRGANFYFYTSLALVFAITSLSLLFRGASLGVLWAALGILAGWAARRYGRGTLAVHSLVYVVAATIPSGLASASLAGLFASTDVAWAPTRLAAWAVLIAIGLCWLLTTPAPGSAAGGGPDVPRWALACLVAVSVAGVVVVVARSTLAPEWGAPLVAAIVATVRTGVLAVAAIVVAWLGRRALTHEFGALLYPVLAWGALKLLLEDLRTSPPSLLVVAFVLYGGALILGPRIAKTPTPA
jgi:hypothetical protein